METFFKWYLLLCLPVSPNYDRTQGENNHNEQTVNDDITGQGKKKKNVDNQWPQLIVIKVFLNYGNTGGVLKVMQYI